jgi:hypothetical protein
MADPSEVQGDMSRGDHDYLQYGVVDDPDGPDSRGLEYLVECLHCGWVNRRSLEHFAINAKQGHKNACGGEVVYAPDGGLRPAENGGGDGD